MVYRELGFTNHVVYPFNSRILMPRKKSVKLAAQTFIAATDNIYGFFNNTRNVVEEAHHHWCTDYAVIRLYAEFEILMLRAIVGAINRDTTALAESTGFKCPKHLSQDVCTYLVIGSGYFDFKGREGLLGILKRFVSPTHYLYRSTKNIKYKTALEQLIALRNFAAHRSERAKKAAIKTTAAKRIGSAGAWLRIQDRFEHVCISLKKLAREIEHNAPY